TAMVVLAALCLLGLFSTEIADTDFWWHLKTGEYIWQHRSLPVPDPFSFTADLGAPAFEGEARVRYFNLTHEWLGQLLWYAVYRLAGFPGVVLFKALLLTAFCGIAGLLAARRTGSRYWGLAAAGAASSLAVLFSVDRPALLTFFFVAVFVWILERGSPLWLLPVLALVWANCHGGFFLGWVVLGAYAAGATIRRRPAQLAATRLGGMEPAASLGPAVRVRRSAVCCYRGADCGAAAGAPERLAVVLAVRCRLTAGVPKHPPHRLPGAHPDCLLFPLAAALAGCCGAGGVPAAGRSAGSRHLPRPIFSVEGRFVEISRRRGRVPARQPCRRASFQYL